MTLEGLPEGVEASRVGVPQDDEFVLEGLSIIKPAQTWTYFGLIVKPADGYRFVYEPYRNTYRLAKQFEQPKLLRFSVLVDNSVSETRLSEWLDRLAEYVTITKE